MHRLHLYMRKSYTTLTHCIGAIRVNEKGEFKLPYRRFLNGIRNTLETGIRNTRGWNPEYSRLKSGILKVGIRNPRVLRITLHGTIPATIPFALLKSCHENTVCTEIIIKTAYLR